MKCKQCGGSDMKVTDSCASDNEDKAAVSWPKRVPREPNTRFRSRRCGDCYTIHWFLEKEIDRDTVYDV
tara:strand:+ start:12684 stop:12890 length:207 start_codon:yes stop_codon:yes gene_type:complete